MEELFWRSLVMRWLEDTDFAALNPAQVGFRALLLSSLAFGFEHSQWLAGVLAGIAYGWLYQRSGNLWVAVVAHATTNVGLGLWVLATGAWYFW
jgi:CAAX prenyl protease-like protein